MNTTSSSKRKKREWRIKKTDFSKELADLISCLLENRGILTKEDQERFLNSTLDTLSAASVNIDLTELEKTKKRILTAIKNKEKIIVFGDYDVDGVTGAAVLWETLHSMGANVTPYIPNRIEEGYGLSTSGINNLPLDTKLIITVDNGIVAFIPSLYAKEKGIDVIITDHHAKEAKLPDVYSIVHTTKLCGAGVAYMVALELVGKEKVEELCLLELVTLATIADLVPLKETNRALVKFGLPKLSQTKRPGLLALFKEAGIDKTGITPYTIGHVIAPRINAMGRMESAMDSLRLLCTKSRERAEVLASLLGGTNKTRQSVTIESVMHAKNMWITKENQPKLIFIAHESYEQGVIGLIAGRLVEEFYRPAIVLSIGKEYAKASARSIAGLNIIETIRLVNDHLVNAGGHPMAAGFTVANDKVTLIQEILEKYVDSVLTDDLLIRSLHIDCEIPLSLVSQQLLFLIRTLAPFGMDNPEPVFVSHSCIVQDARSIGKDGSHLKLKVTDTTRRAIDAIAFGFGDLAYEISPGQAISLAYTVDENTWNGKTTIQLVVKDIQL